MPAVWVAALHISDRTAQKIVQTHRITPDEVREAVVGVVGLRYVWSEDPERGERAIIETTIRGDASSLFCTRGRARWATSGTLAAPTQLGRSAI